MLKLRLKDESTGRFKWVYMAERDLPVAKIILSLPCMDGNVQKIYFPEIISRQQKRQCAWCGKIFKPKYLKMQRFCGASCSAKWRMSTPEHKVKVHTQETHAKIGRAVSVWLQSNDPKAKKQVDRIRNLNPMEDPASVQKMIDTKTRNGTFREWKGARGGNGRGMTKAQFLLKSHLSKEWMSELPIPLGKQQEGYPSCYKVDLGNAGLKIAIEVDGPGHKNYKRQEKDRKKEAKLASLGWIVLRFWNKQIIDWIDTGMKKDSYISTILRQNNIRLFR